MCEIHVPATINDMKYFIINNSIVNSVMTLIHNVLIMNSQCYANDVLLHIPLHLENLCIQCSSWKSRENRHIPLFKDVCIHA